jgi:hypothetical protein
MSRHITYYLLSDFQETSINVEHVFSQGYLLLSHVWSCLSVHSMCVLLCLGKWSTLDLIKDSNLRACIVDKYRAQVAALTDLGTMDPQIRYL